MQQTKCIGSRVWLLIHGNSFERCDQVTVTSDEIRIIIEPEGESPYPCYIFVNFGGLRYENEIFESEASALKAAIAYQEGLLQKMEELRKSQKGNLLILRSQLLRRCI